MSSEQGQTSDLVETSKATTVISSVTEIVEELRQGRMVILVDEDVDIFDTNDVLWAMTTRMQADVDIVTIPGVRCHPLDPSNDPACSWSIRDHGIACKTIYDATIPFNQKARFQRAKFMEVDVKKFLPDFTVQD